MTVIWCVARKANLLSWSVIGVAHTQGVLSVGSWGQLPPHVVLQQGVAGSLKLLPVRGGGAGWTLVMIINYTDTSARYLCLVFCVCFLVFCGFSSFATPTTYSIPIQSVVN